MFAKINHMAMISPIYPMLANFYEAYFGLKRSGKTSRPLNAVTVGDGSPELTYGSYLALDEVLGAQRPQSDEHDEMLFIVIHQVYELWFKQLLHELAHLQYMLEKVDTAHSVRTLRRALTILKVVVAQIDVLETMTPRQFTSFRARLDAASGFQSGQFRELEAVLGRRDERMLQPYAKGSEAHDRITAAMSRRSIFDSFLLYLAGSGYDIPSGHLNRDLRLPWEAAPEVQRVLVQVYGDDAGPHDEHGRGGRGGATSGHRGREGSRR